VNWLRQFTLSPYLCVVGSFHRGLQALSKKGWKVMSGPNGPFDPWLDKAWKPGEIEEAK
jgi:hypothetical protein